MPTLLIVDDNPDDRLAAERYLKRVPGADLIHAGDGAEAVDVLADDPPDLVVTDLRMPHMGGLELVKRVQATSPTIPVVVMTSVGNEQIAVEAIQAGAASYVPKSNFETHLVDTVEQVLKVSTARRQREQLLRYLDHAETSFAIENDPTLIPPLIAHLLVSLSRMNLCDDAGRTRVGMALQEALDNALYHGNLSLSSSLREEDMTAYYDEANKRREQSPYKDRRIHVTARETHDEVVYTIQDEGEGFDPSALPDPTSPEAMERVHGRGLLLINSFMDKVEHNDKGNVIVMAKGAAR